MPKHIDFTTQPIAVRLAARCIGLDHKRPYIRLGKLFYRPYRNYYYAKASLTWERLVEQGFAKDDYKKTKDGFPVYCLTRAGLDWLGDQLGITIFDKED